MTTVRDGTRARGGWPAVLAALDALGPDPSAVRVVDVGGGTGGWAVPLARRGHPVDVVDPSPDALATLRRRCVEQGVQDHVRAVLGEVDALHGTPPADLALAHHILEYVDDPFATLRAVASAVRPGGTVSVLVRTRAGAVLGRALAGHAEEALHAVRDADGRVSLSDTMPRRYDADGLLALAAEVGLRPTHLAGEGLLDSLRPGDADGRPEPSGPAGGLAEVLATTTPYRDLAPTLHLVATTG